MNDVYAKVAIKIFNTTLAFNYFVCIFALGFYVNELTIGIALRAEKFGAFFFFAYL